MTDILPEAAGRGLDMPADLAAFEALFASHGSRMKSLALNVLGNQSDAEDAVQDAFLRAYRGRQAFKGDAALWTWVYRILLNVCYDVGRRRKTRGEQALDADPALDLPSPTNDHPLRLALQRALGTLQPIYREVFLLCEVEGHTHRESRRFSAFPKAHPRDDCSRRGGSSRRCCAASGRNTCGRNTG